MRLALRSKHAVPVPSVSQVEAGAAHLRSDLNEAPGWMQIDRAVMALALMSLGLRTTLISGLTVGCLFGLVLAPVWLLRLKAFWGARTLVWVGTGALIGGLSLAGMANSGHTVARSVAMADGFLLIGILGGVGIVLWSRSRLSVAAIGVFYGLGLLVNAVVNPGNLSASNPWKFSYVVPIAVIALSAVNRPGCRKLQIVVVVALAISCAVSDARSCFAIFLLVFVILVWQQRPNAMSRRRSWIWTTGALGGVGLGIYYVGQALLVDGYLGADAQARSLEQMRTAGSLILGGRPELAASLALVRDHPWGFGVGVAPTLNDVNSAKAGMFSMLNYQPDAGYVEHFMFGGHIELHSTLGDSWAHFGVIGVLFCLAVVFHVVRGVARRMSTRHASGILTFLGGWTLWNVMFSPAYSAAPTLLLAVGLLLFRQDDTGPATLPSQLLPPEDLA